MIRVPKTVGDAIDTCVGRTHLSRPDVILDACRQFRVALVSFEHSLIESIKDKDVSIEAKDRYYREEVWKFTDPYREFYNKQVKDSKGEVLSILLTMPPGEQIQIEGVVSRDPDIRTHQDYYKLALGYFILHFHKIGTYETDVLDYFLDRMNVDNEVSKLRKELEGS